MKTRRKKPSARGTAAKKPAAPRKRATDVSKADLALGADCTIEHAPGLHKQLVKVLANRACVTLDCSAIKRSDTAGIQVLAAFIRERRDAGRKVELQHASDNLLATAKLLGLSALIGPVTDDGVSAQVGRA